MGCEASCSLYRFHFLYCLLFKMVIHFEKDTENTYEHFQTLFSTILQIENIHNKEVMLQAAHGLRVEREREKSLANQKQEQQASLKHTEQRIQRLQQQLKEIRQAAMGATPEG